MRFQEFVGSTDVNGRSRSIAAAEAEPVDFAVGGEGEDRVAGQRAVCASKIPMGNQALRSGGDGVGLAGIGEQLQRILQWTAFGGDCA